METPEEEKAPENLWMFDNPLTTEFQPNQFQTWFMKNFLPYKENRRDIGWIYHPEGNGGKTTMACAMIATGEALVISGGAKDIFSAIADLKKDGCPPPKFIILNLTRQQEGRLSYSALESLKDRFFFNSKYHSGMICLRYSPTIVVFANRRPDTTMLTVDRWKIYVQSPDGSWGLEDDALRSNSPSGYSII